MKPLVFSLFKHPLATSIAKRLGLDMGALTIRSFPDSETYLKINVPVKDRKIIIIDNLADPDKKILPLLFFALTARELGAKQLGLVAPYLSYMRQDKRFLSGEAITSHYFAKLLSAHFDWLLTIDPHLHRHHDLNAIYSIPAKVLHTASIVSDWIMTNIRNPVLIGPDIESKQWVAELAQKINAPYSILSKVRHNDTKVEILLSNMTQYQNYTPVLIDDIISTGQTMLETIKHLKKINMQPPFCIGVHGIFANNAYEKLLESNAAKIITCNTIVHVSNQIDVTKLLSETLPDYF